jgi:hypothetical protein
MSVLKVLIVLWVLLVSAGVLLVHSVHPMDL